MDGCEGELAPLAARLHRPHSVPCGMLGALAAPGSPLVVFLALGSPARPVARHVARWEQHRGHELARAGSCISCLRRRAIRTLRKAPKA